MASQEFIEALRGYCSKEYENLSKLYSWKISLKNCPIKQYQLTGKNLYENNKNLRIDLHNMLKAGNENSAAIQK